MWKNYISAEQIILRRSRNISHVLLAAKTINYVAHTRSGTVVLNEIVLQNLREAIQFVSRYESDFIREAADMSIRERDKELAQKKETLTKVEKRIAELYLIIKHLYEDSVTGKLLDERFIKLSHDYELEQDNLKQVSEVLRKDLKQQEQNKSNIKSFIAAAKKYTDLRELDATILREFIEKIYISKTSGKSGRWNTDEVREIEIVYNFIGAFDWGRASLEAQNSQNTKKVGID